jgi:hypothetical protein
MIWETAPNLGKSQIALERNMLLRWGLAIVLVMHGVGHAMFALAIWTPIDVSFTGSPWLLPGNVMANSLMGWIAAVVWLLALVGFLLAAFGIVSQAAWWPNVAIAASALSLAVLLLWWNTITPGSRVWAAFVDVAVLLALLGPWKDRVLEIIAQ